MYYDEVSTPGQIVFGSDNDIGGVYTTGAGLISRSANTLDAFAVGTDGAVYHRFFDGSSWHGNENLGGKMRALAPTAVTWDANRIDVFAIGTNGHIQHNSFTGKWNTWEQLAATTNYEVAATTFGPGDLSLFVTGTDSSIWHVWQDSNGWHNDNLGGGTNFALAATKVNLQTGKAITSSIWVFHVGTNGVVFYKKWQNRWSDWFSLGGPGAIGAPQAVSAGANHIEVIVLGKDGAFYRNTFNTVGWGGWEKLGGVFLSAPTNVAYGVRSVGTWNLAAMGIGTDKGAWTNN